MRLFELAGTDFTPNITMATYQVNRVPVYEEWTDANGINHRDTYRSRVSGGFHLKFTENDDYYNFINLVHENTGQSGYTPVTVYLNNYNTVTDVNVFISFEPTNELPYFGKIDKYDGFDVTIEER